MNAVFKKLNFKSQSPIFIVNAPGSFQAEINEMKDQTEIRTNLAGSKVIPFFLAFVTKKSEVDDLAKKVAPLLDEDGVLWFAYPKGSSKKYKCEFNRDTGWSELGRQGFEGVRMVAIDDDWTALRFRKAEHIKAMTRSFAMSEAGKEKVAAKRSPKRTNT